MTTKSTQSQEGPNLLKEAFFHGANDARRAADDFAPTVGEAITKSLYSTSYGVSYGLCFIVFLAGRVVPQNSPVATGVRDGCVDARQKVETIVKMRDTKPTQVSQKNRKRQTADAARRARGEVASTAARITEDTSFAHV